MGLGPLRSFPESFKATARHPCVNHRVVRISMSQVVLHDAQIRGLVGQVVAAAVTQHVWVDLGQSGLMSDAGDQIIDGPGGSAVCRALTRTAREGCRCAWRGSA